MLFMIYSFQRKPKTFGLCGFEDRTVKQYIVTTTRSSSNLKYKVVTVTGGEIVHVKHGNLSSDGVADCSEFDKCAGGWKTAKSMYLWG